jgi:hypothetical protein
MNGSAWLGNTFRIFILEIFSSFLIRKIIYGCEDAYAGISLIYVYINI